MNADNRANPGTGPTFSPRQDDGLADAGRTPQRSSLRPITSDVPVSGQHPSSPYGASSSPVSGQQPTSAQQPVPSQQPVSSQQPTSAQQPTASRQSAASAFSPVNPVATPSTGTQETGAGSAPSNSPSSAPTSDAYPLSGEQSTTDSQSTSSRRGAAFAGAAAGVGATASAGFDRFKGFAARAKEDLTSSDDIAASQRPGGPRKVRVLVSRVDPWSALKIGFLLSIAIGIMMVVAVYVLWGALDSIGFFALANEWVMQLFTDDQEVDLLQFFALNKWMSATVLMAVVNVVLLTALFTLGAFLYNTISKVVGGIYVTLTDD
ncbi:DUF3566 domain-containing protein [Demequina sp. SO4-13]|uniref:DUF3566 domain-containing protein n=1 Tax=Demequina sp. SO4-13 TaxID=3401027 RepID=UPI003AF8CEFD